MIVTIPTSSGAYTFCFNASMIKLLAIVAGILVLIVGYVAVQLSTFILNCSPVEFLRIVLFTLFLAGIGFVARFLFTRKGATI